MITIDIKEFPEYETFPEKGDHMVVDSKVVNLCFEKDNQEYDILARIEVEYQRWYAYATQEVPEWNGYEVKYFDIDLIKGHDNDKDLSDKDLRRLRQYIVDNIEFI
jgi:hypothetical protein